MVNAMGAVHYGVWTAIIDNVIGMTVATLDEEGFVQRAAHGFLKPNIKFEHGQENPKMGARKGIENGRSCKHCFSSLRKEDSRLKEIGYRLICRGALPDPFPIRTYRGLLIPRSTGAYRRLRPPSSGHTKAVKQNRGQCGARPNVNPA